MPINPEDDRERRAPQTESARDGEGDIADEGQRHRDVKLDRQSPTPGSAEGERDRNDQSK
jgi:hypothetical protein